ncbi:LAQU0S01e10858g1_1 [Lachancea quebecensis]|uniref:LAQU0S01e10858g1_1 n=1 Tax=Lachancea quebecensis TaxID=1654605 RepID=A0A0P1KPH9_9SACH|nr:LAQU0S01e10858g1_1 [Lachancea quebecensis]
MIDYSDNFGYSNQCQTAGQAQVAEQGFGVDLHSSSNDDCPAANNLFDGLTEESKVFHELLANNTNTITPPGSSSPGYQQDLLSIMKTDKRGAEINFDCLAREGAPNLAPEANMSAQSFKADTVNSFQQDSNPIEDASARKKKAQNRAAQRAFRERKEAKMKELQEQLLTSERDKQSLLRQMEELREHNLKMLTENHLLLQKNNPSLPTHSGSDAASTSNKFHFPSQSEFIESAIEGHEVPVKLPLSSTNYEHNGEELLTFPATWEYLHKLSEKKDFDVYSVMQNLKGKEVCHGYGPAYKKAVIDQLVKQG